jgi:hypothetical protein
MDFLACNLGNKLGRKRTLNGKAYYVVPATMIVPGILAGSNGPLYYPPEEVSKNPAIWNSTPIVVWHPTKNGQNVSARTPGVVEEYGIGEVRRASYNGKLTAEAWFDVNKTKAFDAKMQKRGIKTNILGRLEDGQKVELSTGLFTDNTPAQNGAQHKGQAYSWIARNYRPDHLAVLPDGRGACSVHDGCGFNANQQPPGQQDFTLVKRSRSYYPPGEKDHDEAMGVGGQAIGKVRKTGVKDGDPAMPSTMPNNETTLEDHSCLLFGVNAYDKSYEDRRAELQTQLRDADEGNMMGGPFIIDLYDDYVILSKKGKLFKQHYEEKDGKCVLTGEPKATVRHTIYNKYVDDVDAKYPGKSKPGKETKEFVHGHDETQMKKHKRNRPVPEGTDTHEDEEESAVDTNNQNQGEPAPVKTATPAIPANPMAPKVPAKPPKPRPAAAGGSAEAQTRVKEQQTAAKGATTPGTAAYPVNEDCPEEEAEDEIDTKPKKVKLNAAPGQVKSDNTGRFKKSGAGHGKGDVHEAAQRGQIQMDDRSKALGKMAMMELDTLGNNPASWAVDEDTWDKAKAAADKGDYSGDTYWAVVAHIYENMGGEIKGGTNNQLQERLMYQGEDIADNGFADDDARQDAFSGMRKDGGNKSKDAIKASKKASKSGSREDHRAAAFEHRAAAMDHDDDGSDELAASHRAAASDHFAQARSTLNQRTTMPRPKNKAELKAAVVANCSCQESREVLNSLSEDTIEELVLTANGKSKGAGSAMGLYDSGHDDFPNEDEEEAEKKRNKDGKLGAQGGTQNAAIESWLQANNAPPALRDLVANAAREEQGKKHRLVAKLVGNIKDDRQRNLTGNQLMGKPLHELEMLASLIPARQSATHNAQEDQQQPRTWFFNANGGNMSLNSEADQQDVSDMTPPVSNWGEPVKKQPTAAAH